MQHTAGGVHFHDDGTATSYLMTKAAPDQAFRHEMCFWACFANRQYNNMGSDGGILAERLFGIVPALANLEAPEEGFPQWLMQFAQDNEADLVQQPRDEPRLCDEHRITGPRRFEAQLIPRGQEFGFALEVKGFGLLGRGLQKYTPWSVTLLFRHLLRKYRAQPEKLAPLLHLAIFTGQSYGDGLVTMRNGDIRASIASATILALFQEEARGEYRPSPTSAVPPIPTPSTTTRAVAARRPPATPNELTLRVGGEVTMRLVPIPAGKFVMGSPETENGRGVEEGPQREVTISKPFYMGMCEVAQEQYEFVMGKNPSNFKGAHNPVECVCWDDAVGFCKMLSQRTGRPVSLPTEAQWEYACRAGSMTRFAYGDNDADLSDYAWYCENSDKQTHPVGQKKPNAFGLYDMHGNVCEWCADELAGSYTDATSVDPFGRGADFIRVLRGGSWRSEPKDCRSASRGRKRWYVDLYNTNGLRVVVNAVGLE